MNSEMLSQEQQMVLQSIKRIAKDHFEKNAFTWEGQRPWENLQLLADQGYLGLNMPEKYGGAGMTELEAMLQIEVIGRICPDTAFALSQQCLVAPRAVEMFGTETVKEEFLPPVLAGEEFMAIAISEPEAGSDVQSMTTTAEETADGIVLNGEKTWVSGVPDARTAVVWVKFPEGLGTVIVELDNPGIEVGNHFTNMAGDTQTQFYLEDVLIPEDYVLTRGRDAFKKQLKALNWERIGSASVSNTIAVCALDQSLEYAQQREQFGEPIGDFQGMEWKLADMAREIEASRALTYDAITTVQNGSDGLDRFQTSIAKLFSSQMVEKIVSEALQVHGANGYQQGHSIEYLYRLARGRRLGGGTDEIQKNTIAKALKEKGFPSII